MAMQISKSTLFQKLGEKLAQAHEEHKFDAPDTGNMELPAGIQNGIAQLEVCEFKVIPAGKKNAGKDYFYMVGTVKLPLEHDGVPVFGLRTFVMENLFDTPDHSSRKTVSDHLGFIYQHYLLPFGVDVANLDVRDLEATCAQLAEAKPHFRFRTWKGQKQSKEVLIAQGMSPARAEELSKREPMTNHSWGGMVDYVDPDQYQMGADGNVGNVPQPKPTQAQVPPSNPQRLPGAPGSRLPAAASTQQTPAAKITANGQGASQRQTVPTQVPLSSQENPAADIDGALSELADAANQGDDEAAIKLAEIAESVGVSKIDITGASDWMEVVGMIELGQASSQSVTEEVPAPVLPQKGEVWAYHPIDFKSKQPSAKAVKVEVVSVDEAKETCTLKNLENPKVNYKSIPLTSLLPA